MRKTWLSLAVGDQSSRVAMTTALRMAAMPNGTIRPKYLLMGLSRRQVRQVNRLNVVIYVVVTSSSWMQ